MMANQNQTRWDFLVFYISFPSSWFLVIINIYSSFDNKKNSSSLSLRTGENFWRGSPPLLFQMSERRCASRPNASDGLPAARVGQSFSSSFYSVFFSPLLPFQKERERLFPAAGWRRSKVSLSLYGKCRHKRAGPSLISARPFDFPQIWRCKNGSIGLWSDDVLADCNSSRTVGTALMNAIAARHSDALFHAVLIRQANIIYTSL